MAIQARNFVHTALLIGGLLTTGYVVAQEITLRAVNAFPEGTYFAQTFETFVKKVNAEGKGILQINYLGGPKAMPASQHGTSLRRGVIDLANTTASNTSSLVPEGMALSFSSRPMSELRRNGALDYLNQLYLEKDIYYLGRTAESIPYHIFTNKKIANLSELKGQKLRISAIYRDFFLALDTRVTDIPYGEVYTALERGVIDGFGWTLVGIFDLGWQEKIKYRIDPGFYSVEAGMVMSANVWKGLTHEQRAFLEKQVKQLEEENPKRAKIDIERELNRLKDGGIQTITLDPDEAKRFIQTANGAAWDGLEKISKHGGKLRFMMSGS